MKGKLHTSSDNHNSILGIADVIYVLLGFLHKLVSAKRLRDGWKDTSKS